MSGKDEMADGEKVPHLFKPTRPEDVFGCLPYKGEAKSIEQMNEGIAVEVRRRHGLGRY